jgi:hypothetical protein
LKLDVLHPNGSGDWLPLTIINVDDSGNDSKILRIKVENTDQNNSEFKITYPNQKKITQCRTHLPKRDCKCS